jgi:hypothetical protein
MAKKYLKRLWFLATVPATFAVIVIFGTIWEILFGQWDIEDIRFWE